MTLFDGHLAELGFVHGFSTREGGVSDGSFRSMNLGRAIGDRDENVEENHRRFAKEIGYSELFEVSQVHGTYVREVSAAEDPKRVREEEGDALIARQAGVAIGVRTADCVPLLLAHPQTGVVAAVHAGWRGVEAGIAGKSVRALCVPPTEIIAVAGPHIRGASFEVGEDIAERLSASSSATGVVERDGTSQPRVDLFRILEAQLAPLGIRLADMGGDTYAEPKRFFSYRRDGKTGRHLSMIVAGRTA